MIHYKNFEELKEKFPLGQYVYYEKIETVINTYYNPQDLKIYRNQFLEVEIINEYKCKCYYNSISAINIDGYIFDGINWYPAMDTWDGFVFLDDDDIEHCLNAKRFIPKI